MVSVSRADPGWYVKGSQMPVSCRCGQTFPDRATHAEHVMAYIDMLWGKELRLATPERIQRMHRITGETLTDDGSYGAPGRARGGGDGDSAD